MSRSFHPRILCWPDRNGRIDPGWLEALRTSFPESSLSTRPALARSLDLEPLDCASARPSDVLAALQMRLQSDEQAAWPQDGVLVIRSGLVAPAFFAERLRQIAACEQAPIVTVFPGNYAASLDPFTAAKASGDRRLPDRARLDSLVFAAARRTWIAVGELPSDCFYLNARDVRAALRRLSRDDEQALIDDSYVLDPTRPIGRDGRLSPAARAAFGPAVEAVSRDRYEGPEPLPAYGADGRPVTLHISHSWGGGIARWIDDFQAGDQEGHHLILCSGGDTRGQVHGEVLRLYAAGPGRVLLREFVLTPPIADTIRSHARSRAILDWLTTRYGIGRVVVSSLIGHSLDSLRTGLPTLQVLHDFYPATPLLDVDPLDYIDSAGRLRMQRALDEQRGQLKFAAHSAGHWQALRSAWHDSVDQYAVRLLAPSEHVAKRWRALFADQVERIEVQGHGFAAPWGEVEPVRSRERGDGRLTLVVVGRQSEGKGLRLLDQALDGLRPHAQIVLVGAGRPAHALFGRPGVDIILDYDRDRLPELLRTIGPHAALFLSTVPETWNYVLSEARSLGLAPLATRVGSFPERIRDGIDGHLFEPTPEDLVARVAALAADRSSLASLASAAPAEPGIAEAIARYREVCAPQVRAARPGAPADPLDAGRFDAVLERERNVRLLERIENLNAEVDRRTDWAQRQQRLASERTAWARASQEEIRRLGEISQSLTQRCETLENELVERTAWAHSQEARSQAHLEWARSLEKDVESARAALSEVQASNADLEQQLAERADWAHGLERELGEVRADLDRQRREWDDQRRRFESQIEAQAAEL
ncbi:MAG: glycosyltransferase, partial [Wenzhouxiangella sp.]|nr:glycosyltransferase [Wenzhouxiangella sp.]